MCQKYLCDDTVASRSIRNTFLSLPLYYLNPVVLIKSVFLVSRRLRSAIYGPRYWVWHLEVGNSTGDPFYASTGELSPLIFALNFSLIWFILLPSFMGNVLRGSGGVMYFLSGYIPACPLFAGHDPPSCGVSCYHLLVPVQVYHHQQKVFTRIFPHCTFILSGKQDAVIFETIHVGVDT